MLWILDASVVSDTKKDVLSVDDDNDVVDLTSISGVADFTLGIFVYCVC